MQVQPGTLLPYISKPKLWFGMPRRTTIALLLDLSAIAGAAFLAWSVGYGVDPSLALSDPQCQLFVAITLGIRLFVQGAFGLYRVSWYLFTFSDGVRTALAWLVASILNAAVAWSVFEPTFNQWGASSWILEPCLSLLALIGMRSCARWTGELKSKVKNPENQRRALMVGAGQAAVAAIRDLRGQAQHGYNVVGLLDDDDKTWGLQIEGISVLGSTERVVEFAERLDVDCIILALPSAKRERVRDIVELCQATKRPLYTLPSLGELLSGRVHISHLRPLRIEELLGRGENLLESKDWEKVQESFSGARILVTGAGGSIGSELCRQLSQLSPAQLIMVDNNENNLFEIEQTIRREEISSQACLIDVRDRERLQEIFAMYRPQVIFHAAAFKHVPMMERHPKDAILNNAIGTKNVADLAHEFKASHFVQISTDKAVNPTNVMGASKRLAEMIVQSLAERSSTRFCCVRFGNVLGSRGSVVHTFRRQIAAGGPVTITDPEVTRFFMTIPEAVRLVIQAGAHGNGGELFLLDMGEPVKIVDLAREMIRLTGHRDDEIPIEFIGLRPGEKLYEELLLSDEGTRASGLNKIFLADSPPVDDVKLRELLELLQNAATSGSASAIRQMLLGAGIGYRPSEEQRQRDRAAIASHGAKVLSLGKLAQAANQIPETAKPELSPTPREASAGR